MKDFRANLPMHLDQIGRSGGPIMITRHGRPAGVLLSAARYEELLAKAQLLEDVQAIKAGMAEIHAGRGIDADQAMREIAAEIGLNADR